MALTPMQSIYAGACSADAAIAFVSHYGTIDKGTFVRPYVQPQEYARSKLRHIRSKQRSRAETRHSSTPRFVLWCGMFMLTLIILAVFSGFVLIFVVCLHT